MLEVVLDAIVSLRLIEADAVTETVVVLEVVLDAIVSLRLIEADAGIETEVAEDVARLLSSAHITSNLQDSVAYDSE